MEKVGFGLARSVGRPGARNAGIHGGMAAPTGLLLHAGEAWLAPYIELVTRPRYAQPRRKRAVSSPAVIWNARNQGEGRD